MTWRKIVCWLIGHKKLEQRYMQRIVCVRCKKILGELKSETDFSLRAKRFLDQPRKMREERIAELNRNRRQKFAHAEHFKRRQPTTARKLWNPQAQPKKEREEDAKSD